MATLEQVIEEVQHLKQDELRHLRGKIDELLTESDEPLMTEEEFAQYLAAKGMIAPLTRTTNKIEEDDWEPIEVTGKPLSEIIIEERR